MGAMKPEYHLVRPLGWRSCLQWRAGKRVPGEGGSWSYVRVASSGRNQYLLDLECVLRRFDDRERKMLAAEIKVLMRRAAEGKLTYAPSPEGQVEQMSCVDAVLELRMVGHPLVADGGELLTRLYFNEPRGYPGMLIGLYIAGKMPGPMMKDEQNRHAAEAQRRLETGRFEPMSV